MEFNPFHLTTLQWALAILSAFILGVSKSGINSVSLITVTILAFVFGGKVSTGVLLPMLSFADIMAVKYYHRHTQWKYLFKLLPSMIIGVLLGVWFGKDISEGLFKKAMALLIIITVITMVWWEKRKKAEVTDSKVFSNVMGLGAGFTTMVGNMAGAFSNLYFLAMRLPKEHFIGTAAWLFLIINAFKIPFHIFIWHTITFKSISLNLLLLPVTVSGFYFGIQIVKKLKDGVYRQVILALTFVAAIFLLLSI